MTPEEINRIIVEKGQGKCWHEWVTGGVQVFCRKCENKLITSPNPDFTKWENFGELLKVVNKLQLFTDNPINQKLELWRYGSGLIDKIPLLVATEVARVLEEK